MELIASLLPGFFLSAIAGVLAYLFFNGRPSSRDADDLASFFFPSELISSGAMRLYRWTFCLIIAIGLFVAFLIIAQDDHAVRGVNIYLISQLQTVLPAGLSSNVLDGWKKGFQAESTQQTVQAWAALCLTGFAALYALVFLPHLKYAYGWLRSLMQQVIIRPALDQSRDAARHLALAGTDEALQDLHARYGTVPVPPEIAKAGNPELQLQYTVLSIAARTASREGFSCAIDRIRRDRQSPPPPLLTPKRLVAAGVIYLVGCVLYIGVVPLLATGGADCFHTPRLMIPIIGVACDWIGTNARSIGDLAIEVTKFSLIVILPLVAGLHSYTSRRRRLPNEDALSALTDVLSSLAIISLVCGSFFVAVEFLRYYYQPAGTCALADANLPPAHKSFADVICSLGSNFVSIFFMMLLPLILVATWAALLRWKVSLLAINVAACTVAALYCCLAMRAFEQMVKEPDQPRLVLEFHSALLGAYLVFLMGCCALLFLRDIFRQLPPDRGPQAAGVPAAGTT